MEKVTFAGPTDNTCDCCLGTPYQRNTGLFYALQSMKYAAVLSSVPGGLLHELHTVPIL